MTEFFYIVTTLEDSEIHHKGLLHYVTNGCNHSLSHVVDIIYSQGSGCPGAVLKSNIVVLLVTVKCKRNALQLYCLRMKIISVGYCINTCICAINNLDFGSLSLTAIL